MSEPATLPQDIYTSRRAKLERLRANGIDPYPHAFDTTHTISQLAEAHWASSGRSAARLLMRPWCPPDHRHQGLPFEGHDESGEVR